MIGAEAEAKLDKLYQLWQRRWVDAKSKLDEIEASAAMQALADVYAILELETP